MQVASLVGTKFCIALVYKGFNETSSGIYTGVVGKDGALVKALTKTNVKKDCVTLTAAQVTTLKANGMYFNVLSAVSNRSERALKTQIYISILI